MIMFRDLEVLDVMDALVVGEQNVVIHQGISCMPGVELIQQRLMGLWLWVCGNSLLDLTELTQI